MFKSTLFSLPMPAFSGLLNGTRLVLNQNAALFSIAVEPNWMA